MTSSHQAEHRYPAVDSEASGPVAWRRRQGSGVVAKGTELVGSVVMEESTAAGPEGQARQTAAESVAVEMKESRS